MKNSHRSNVQIDVRPMPRSYPTLVYGGVYKPRGQTTRTNEGGGGVAQMTTTLNNSYLVKVSTKGGEGVKIAQNSVHVVCTRPLYGRSKYSKYIIS